LDEKKSLETRQTLFREPNDIASVGFAALNLACRPANTQPADTDLPQPSNF